MRRRYIQIDGKLVEITHMPRPERKGPYIMTDIRPYRSPIDGREISSRKQRREDLKRNECRPYEGFEQENKVAMQYRADQDKQFESKLDGMLEKTYHQLRDGMTEPAREIKPAWLVGED